MNLLIGMAGNFNVDYFNTYIEYQKHTVKGSNLTDGLLDSFTSLAPAVVNVAFYILMITFVFFTIVLAAAVTTKNTQWMKTSVGGILGTFISILALRLTPLLIFTIDIEGVTVFMRNIVSFLTSVGIHVAIGMFLIGLFLKMLSNIFEHPKYFKWSRSLRIGSAVIIFLSIVSPIVIGNV